MQRKRVHPVDVQIGNCVRFHRMLIGMSQERLGALLGLTFQQIQKYEKGANRISAGRLFELARIFNVPVASFYKDTNAVTDQPDTAAGLATAGMEFASSGEGMQLSLAFMKIKSNKVRRHVLELVKGLTEEGA
jgi:transcriptional regulator with XRE-family HTH domain